jgi:hypothetical protein
MATRPYIAPEDLTPFEAQTILVFFNQATTAREIGDRIEIQGEYDVGTRVGQRILDRRAALGGAFTDVQQIADVPYVGPERFTEIVVVLTGRVPGATTIPPDVQAELDALRAALASAQPNRGITLSTARSEVFLGQPVVAIATVTDLATRRPKPAVTLTVSTSWGTLQSPFGMQLTEGEVVVVRTDANGRVKLTLRSPVDEQLTTLQRADLESALLLLDAQASSPEAARASLEAVASAYRIERNVQLRNAIDIHFRAQREAITAGINRGDVMHGWRIRQALVTAYVHAEGEGGAQTATAQLTALLPLRIRDWLAPFFRVYRDALERDSPLDDTLNRLQANNTDRTVLLDQLVGGMHSYVARERGLLGESAGQSVTDRSVRRFVSRSVATLPVDTQVSILPGLGIAAQNVRAAGRGSLGAVTQSRADVRTEVETITEPLGDLATLATEIEGVQAQLTQFQTGFTQFQNDLLTFNTNLTQFNTDYGVFEENLPIIIGLGNLDPGIIGGLGSFDPGIIGGAGQPGPIVAPGPGLAPGGAGIAGIAGAVTPPVTPVGDAGVRSRDDAAGRAPEGGADTPEGGSPPRTPRTPRGGGTPPDERGGP